jgi:hypothetical protein
VSFEEINALQERMVRRRMRASSLPILIAKVDSGPNLLGSDGTATLFATAAHYYILTAAHVLEGRTHNNDYRFALPITHVDGHEPTFNTHEFSTELCFIDPDCDVLACRIMHPSIVKELTGHGHVFLTKNDCTTEPADRYRFYGWPNDGNVIDGRTMQSDALRLTTVPYDGPETCGSGEALLRWVDVEGKMGGVSGSPVFAIREQAGIVWGGTGSEFQLAGIQCRIFPEKGWIKYVRYEVVERLLRIAEEERP